jgi:hypothetical protein
MAAGALSPKTSQAAVNTDQAKLCVIELAAISFVRLRAAFPLLSKYLPANNS